jgi:signal transduction histidine kinase
VATFSDITDQRESYRRIRELALRVDAVREDERRSVAQLLHEGIAQDLFAAKLRLRQLLAKARVGDGTAQACSDIGDALDKCMEATRQMANSLRPAALSHMALPEALTEHARYFGDLTGLKISVSTLAPFPSLPDAMQLTFFRAAQELLTNVVKHARASSVAILLDADAGAVSMDVVDDGVGIDLVSVERQGALGLLGLRERISALGGELRLQRNPDVGTTVSVRLPRSAQAVRLVS